MKVFISQPMRDKTDKEIKEAREFAVDCIRMYFPDEEVEIIDSFFEGAPHDAKPLWFLGESFKKLADADLAYFIRGWDEYRGCKMENQAAKQYGIEVIEECLLRSGDVELRKYNTDGVHVSAEFPKSLNSIPCTILMTFTGKYELGCYKKLITNRLSTEYPELSISTIDCCDKKDDNGEYYYQAVIECDVDRSANIDDIIKLTHHAEPLYTDTDMEYVHVEVRIDGEWYGREENENA